jgi:hypothetical protein
MGGANAGGGMGGRATGGTGGITGPPPGWWTHDTWHGCAWIGLDTLTLTTTTSTPMDFMMHQSGTGYCVQGSVHPDYEGVAVLGFNLNETRNGSATQCAYDPDWWGQTLPPAVTLSGNGIAMNFVKTTPLPRFWIYLLGPNGALTQSDRWCYEITPAAGPAFAPFSMFNTQCWDGSGSAYTGQPISAITFWVPGFMGETVTFDYCINGFDTGTSAADAPNWNTGG